MYRRAAGANLQSPPFVDEPPTDERDPLADPGPRRRSRHRAPRARPLGHAPDRRAAPRPLPRRAEELGAPAGRVRVLLLRRRLARADDALRRARHHREERLRHGDRLARRRHRPRQRDHLHPEPPARARRAVHAAGDGHAARLARARADLQGPDGEAQGPRPRDLRLPRLPAAAGGRHPDLQGRLRAGGRGPVVARRADARGRAPLQPSLRPRAELRRAGAETSSRSSARTRPRRSRRRARPSRKKAARKRCRRRAPWSPPARRSARPIASGSMPGSAAPARRSCASRRRCTPRC